MANFLSNLFGGFSDAEKTVLFNQLRKIMANSEDAKVKLQSTLDTLDKVSSETSALLQKVIDLQAAAAGNVPDDVMALINQLGDVAVSIDQKVDDVAPNPTPSPEIPETPDQP